MPGVIAAFQSLGVVFSDERANFDDSVVTDTSAEKRRDMMGAWQPGGCCLWNTRRGGTGSNGRLIERLL